MCFMRSKFIPNVLLLRGSHAGGIIESNFFEYADGNASTVNSEKYGTTISLHLVLQMDSLYIKDMGFQQDGTTCHIVTGDILALSLVGTITQEIFKVHVNKPLTSQSIKQKIRCYVSCHNYAKLLF